MALIQPVILSGGSGTRLWPASRSMYPKQLLPMTGDKTMLQETVMRLDGVEGLTGTTLVICNEAHRFLVAEQLREIDVQADIVLEPAGRNTSATRIREKAYLWRTDVRASKRRNRDISYR